jgi:hypothetical protein
VQCFGFEQRAPRRSVTFGIQQIHDLSFSTRRWRRLAPENGGGEARNGLAQAGRWAGEFASNSRYSQVT